MTGFEAGFDGDADADGVMNGYEWATGTSPTNSRSFGRLTISSAGDDVWVRFSRNTNATDVHFSLLCSSELSSPNFWTSIASNHLGAWLPPVPPVSLSEGGGESPFDVTVTDRRTNAPWDFIG